MDEEGECRPTTHPLAKINNSTFLAAAKHAAFVKARGRHYSNEAEAMKVRPPTTHSDRAILSLPS